MPRCSATTRHWSSQTGEPDDPAAERRAFEGFIDFVMQRLRVDPALHVYHYAGYEPNALKRLAGRYGTREDDVDRLLRGKVLVDLYAVVRRSLQASTDSYSLKKLEPLYMEGRDDAITSGTSSIVAYERWMRHGDPQQLADIAAYNETDCRSTLLLRNWLESLRGEYLRKFGEQLPRPVAGEPEPSEQTAAFSAETEALHNRLREGIPDDEGELDAEQRGRLLLANLLDWHRRESRPEWWDYFARRAKTEEELFDDPHAVAGLVPLGDPVVEGKDELQEYGFDPAQETRIDPGNRWHDPATGKEAGSVEWLDRAAGRLRLRRPHR